MDIRAKRAIEKIENKRLNCKQVLEIEPDPWVRGKIEAYKHAIAAIEAEFEESTLMDDIKKIREITEDDDPDLYTREGK